MSIAGASSIFGIDNFYWKLNAGKINNWIGLKSVKCTTFGWENSGQA
jgi:hypothetical protein